MRAGAGKPEVVLEFFLPPARLQPFITTLYSFQVHSVRRDGADSVRDWLHPEWANLRIAMAGQLHAAIGDAEPDPMPRMVLTGPTSHAIDFVAPPCRTWGIGILPLGWARLVGQGADAYADRSADVEADPALGHLRPLGDMSAMRDRDEERAHLLTTLDALLGTPHRREEEIVAAQRALLDPSCATVAQLAESLAMTTRTLERFAREVFGFPPGLLLRRQRFLRSLAQFMLDPSMRWIETLDPQYYDQAQFTRDFKRFMGMGPREYAALDHPVLMAAARGRMAAAGAAMQVLHEPAPPPESRRSGPPQ